jgi:hypothetical protein
VPWHQIRNVADVVNRHEHRPRTCETHSSVSNATRDVVPTLSIGRSTARIRQHTSAYVSIRQQTF